MRDKLGKSLDGKEAPRPPHCGDSNGGESRVQDVLQVARRIHPASMNGLGIRTDGDVLRDGTEPRAGFGKAAFQVGLTGELVLEPIQIGHAESMLSGGPEEGVVPLECGEALGGALTVEALEELALRVVPLLCVRARRKEKKKCGGEEKFGISHPDKDQPRTCTALKLSTTWPPGVGRPKLSMGLKREKSSIWSSWRRSSRPVGPEII